MGAQCSYFQSRDWEFEVIYGACRGGEVEHSVYFARYMDIIRDVMFDKVELAIPEQMFNILDVAGYKIVNTYDRMPLGNKVVAKMAAYKPGSACYQNSHFIFPLLYKQTPVFSLFPGRISS